MADRCLIPFSTLQCALPMVMALVVGCAGDISAPEPNPDPPEADGGDAAQQEELPQQQLAPGAWQSMDLAARKRFMSEVVMPTMRPLFVDSDPERFATFSCSSCHGQGAADRAFAMPSADLPSLGGPAADSDEHKQRMTDFMRNTVKPRMAELLGDAELRCSNCHPSAS